MRTSWRVAGAIALGLLSMQAVAQAQLRGQLVEAEEVARFTAAEVVDLVNAFLPEPLPPLLLDLLLGDGHDVMATRVVYQTVDGSGQPDFASGLVVIPDRPLLPPPPIVVYHHGTIASDGEAPSNLGLEALVGYVLASDGYIAVLPDYLGFGASAIPHHPYVHRKTQATAAIDLIRATRQGLRWMRYPHANRIFLVGYSQGGHAAVSTLSEIQARHADEFNLALTAVGSGPYNLAGVQTRYVLEDLLYATPGYLPLLVLGWQPIYDGLVSDLSEVFVPPYDERIPLLFDRENTLPEIQRELPRSWRDFVQPDFVEAIQGNRFHPVNAAFRDNDLLSYRPESPLTMYYCTEDEQVSYLNAVAAWFYYKFLAGSEATIRAVNLGPWRHAEECVVLYVVLAKLQLDANRR